MLFFNPGRFLEPPRQKSQKNAPQLTRHKQQGLSYLILPSTRLIINIQAEYLLNIIDIYIYMPCTIQCFFCIAQIPYPSNCHHREKSRTKSDLDLPQTRSSPTRQPRYVQNRHKPACALSFPCTKTNITCIQERRSSKKIFIP